MLDLTAASSMARLAVKQKGQTISLATLTATVLPAVVVDDIIDMYVYLVLFYFCLMQNDESFFEKTLLLMKENYIKLRSLWIRATE